MALPGPVRATTPGAGVFPGVVACSEVDAVPGNAGQGGGPVVGHDGGDAAGESLSSLASRAPRASSRKIALANVTGSRPSTDTDFWGQQRALTMPERPPQ
jgi:hypothetical protein